MKYLLYIILATSCLVGASFAAPVEVELTAEHDGHPEWLQAEGGTYMLLGHGEPYSVEVPARVAVGIYTENELLNLVWDDPTDRNIPFMVMWDDAIPQAKRFIAQARLYLGGAWKAGHLYAEGDKVAVGDLYSGQPYIVEAVPTGGGEVSWHKFLSGAVVDNADGTVSLPCIGHDFAQNDQIILRQAGPYTGSYTLPLQADPDLLTLTAPYEAYTLAAPAHVVVVAGSSGLTQPAWPVPKPLFVEGFFSVPAVAISAAAAVDLGNGLVGIPVATHSFVDGDLVVIDGTVNYDREYTQLGAQTLGNANLLVIAATYVAETFGGSASVFLYGVKVVDNADGTVSLPCPGHGFNEGQEVRVSAGTVYDTSHILPLQTDPNWLRVTSSYWPHQVKGGHALLANTNDGGITWRSVKTFGTHTEYLGQSPASNRINMRGQAGEGNVIAQSGVKFTLRNAPPYEPPPYEPVLIQRNQFYDPVAKIFPDSAGPESYPITPVEAVSGAFDGLKLNDQVEYSAPQVGTNTPVNPVTIGAFNNSYRFSGKIWNVNINGVVFPIIEGAGTTVRGYDGTGQLYTGTLASPDLGVFWGGSQDNYFPMLEYGCNIVGGVTILGNPYAPGYDLLGNALAYPALKFNHILKYKMTAAAEVIAALPAAFDGGVPKALALFQLQALHDGEMVFWDAPNSEFTVYK